MKQSMRRYSLATIMAATMACGAAAQGVLERWFVVTYTEQGRPLFNGPHNSLKQCEVRREVLLLNAVTAREGAEAMLRASMRERGERISALSAAQQAVPLVPRAEIDALQSGQEFARQIVEFDTQALGAMRSAAERASQSAICQRS